jgi:hypothetical protein
MILKPSFTLTDDSLKRSLAIGVWQFLTNEASLLYGKNFNEARSHRERIIAAGFADVQHYLYRVGTSFGLFLFLLPRRVTCN